jgi:hypothetical protein
VFDPDQAGATIRQKYSNCNHTTEGVNLHTTGELKVLYHSDIKTAHFLAFKVLFAK